MYNNWRVRHYSNIAADRLAIRREMQHSASVRRGRAKEVPFGVRALEKGVEIEGVWNSGVTTPATSVPVSPDLSAIIMKDGTQLDSSLVGSSASVPTDTRVRPPRPSSRPLSTGAEPSRSRATYEPRRSSRLRYSNADEHDDCDESLSALGGRYDTDDSREEREAIFWSGSSTNDQETQEDSSLPPNSRTPSHIEDLPEPTDHDFSVNSSQFSQDSNPFLTPTTTRISIDEALPIAPLDDSILRHSIGDSAIHHAEMLNNAEIAYGEGHARPFRPFDPGRQNKKSQVIRKINSGFEILKPGTLDQPRQISETIAERNGEDFYDQRKPRKLQRKGRRGSVGGASLRT